MSPIDTRCTDPLVIVDAGLQLLVMDEGHNLVAQRLGVYVCQSFVSNILNSRH